MKGAGKQCQEGLASHSSKSQRFGFLFPKVIFATEGIELSH